MPTLVFLRPNGPPSTVPATVGSSVMQAATRAGLPEILAECGGNAMCATCHVYVDDGWVARLPAMSEDEDALLDGAAAERRATSRLSCQIAVAPELDGLVLHLPDRQI